MLEEEDKFLQMVDITVVAQEERLLVHRLLPAAAAVQRIYAIRATHQMTVYWLPVVAVVLRGTEFRVAVEATAAAAAVDTMVAAVVQLGRVQLPAQIQPAARKQLVARAVYQHIRQQHLLITDRTDL
jgi:type IV secretory pathway VirJ component